MIVLEADGILCGLRVDQVDHVASLFETGGAVLAALLNLDQFKRPDNPLFVPETGNAVEYARFLWPTLGRGALPAARSASGNTNTLTAPGT